jgi:hypothetical protein
MLNFAFPSLKDDRAPIPYELGMAVLIAWIGETVHRIEAVKGRYPPGFWLWDFIDGHDLEYFFPWVCVTSALLIVMGVARYMGGCGTGRNLRVAGLSIASVVFLFIALGHLANSFYSVAGAPYLFLGWRTAVLASLYARIL